MIDSDIKLYMGPVQHSQYTHYLSGNNHQQWQGMEFRFDCFKVKYGASLTKVRETESYQKKIYK